MTGQLLTNLELTLLGIIAEGTRCDHEVETVIAARQLAQWLTLGASSVGCGLERLKAHGLITAAPEGDAIRCTITEAGRGVLHTAVMELIGRRRPLAGLAPGLVNLHVLKPAHGWQALTHQRADLRAALLRLTEIAAALPTPSALVSYEIAVMQAELTWLEASLQDWQTRYPELRHTTETPSAAVPAADPPANSTTLIHRPTPVHRNKQVQAIRRPAQSANPLDSAEEDGGSSQ